MKVQVVTLLAVALLLTACSPGPIRMQDVQALSKNYRDFTVIVEVIDGKRVELSAPQGDDAQGKQKGWVGFARGEYGIIRFATTEYPEKTECTEHSDTTAEWVLTEVVLSRDGDKKDQKGEDFGERLHGWIVNAFPTLSVNGYLVKEPIDSAQTSAVLINANNNAGQQMAFYQIEVQRCDGEGDPIRTDPGIGNRGK